MFPFVVSHSTGAVTKNVNWRRPRINFWYLELVYHQTARTEKGLPLQDTPEVTGIIAFRKVFTNPLDYYYCMWQSLFALRLVLNHRMNRQLALDFYRLCHYPFLLIFSCWSSRNAFMCELYISLGSGRSNTVRRLLSILNAHTTGDHMLMKPCRCSGKERRLRAFHSGAGGTGQILRHRLYSSSGGYVAA